MKIKDLKDLLDKYPDAMNIDFSIDFINGIHCGETSEDTMLVSLSDMELDDYFEYKNDKTILLVREGIVP